MLHADPHVSDRSDSQLVEAIARRDPAAVGALYDRYAAGLTGLAMRIVANPADAEEVVAEAFTQAWRDAGRYDPERGSVASWLVTITRSRALDLVRARGRRQRAGDSVRQEAAVGMPAMGTPPPRADQRALDQERQVRVRDALGHLPEEQRQVIELAYFEGYSQSEIADHLGTPLGTVKTRARLALAKLRDLLGPLAPEGGR